MTAHIYKHTRRSKELRDKMTTEILGPDIGENRAVALTHFLEGRFDEAQECFKVLCMDKYSKAIATLPQVRIRRLGLIIKKGLGL